MPSEPAKDGSEGDYEAHEAYSTVKRAHEHMANPKLMKRMGKVHKRVSKGNAKMDKVFGCCKAGSNMGAALMEPDKDD